jgi:hypothetical protein
MRLFRRGLLHLLLLRARPMRRKAGHAPLSRISIKPNLRQNSKSIFSEVI